MRNTFHLTEAKADLPRSHTRVRSLAPSPSLNLPALKSWSPSNFSTQSSAQPSRDQPYTLGSQTTHSQPISPQHKAADRLKRIDIEVKNYFDTLFSRSRHKLLTAVRQMELSPHVQADLHLLQGRVLKLREKYDELRRERQKKTEILKQKSELIEIEQEFPQNKTDLEQRRLDLESDLRAANAKLEQELIYSQKLEYMKEVRRKEAATAREPLEVMRGQVRHLKARLTSTQDSVLRESLASQALNTTQLHQAAELQQSQAQHFHTLQLKTQEYRDHSEMHEFITRFVQQKALERRLRSNEDVIDGLSQEVKNMQMRASKEQEIVENERVAEEYEARLKKLQDVTGACDLTGIVNYWAYLQTSKKDIEATLDDYRKKVDRLRDLHLDLSDELRCMVLSISRHPATRMELQEIQFRSRKSIAMLSNRKDEFTQWDLALHRMTECIERMATKLELPVTTEVVSLPGLLRVIEEKLSGMLAN